MKKSPNKKASVERIILKYEADTSSLETALDRITKKLQKIDALHKRLGKI